MDIWSRFSRCYAIEQKNARLVKKAMTSFFQEFTSLGHLPRRLITDKGSELHIGTTLMEKYRLPRDGTQTLHLRSYTGTPVNIVEAMNAQYQRRAELFRIANIHDDHADILYDISEQLNNQRRPCRGNLTPYQLLALSDAERKKINADYKDNYFTPGTAHNLPPLSKGDHVRKLEMTKKEQVKGQTKKGTGKGFQEKWSREVFQVMRLIALRRNPGVYRYLIGASQSYYRHELLLIPKKVDQKVIVFPTQNRRLIEESTYKPS